MAGPVATHAITILAVTDDDDDTTSLMVGSIVKDDINFVSLAIALLKYTHSLTILPGLFASMANRRRLSFNGVPAQPSCLVPVSATGNIQ